MKPLHVTVTQEHIDAGVQGSLSACPIALAVKESDDTLETVLVGGGQVTLYKTREAGYGTNSYRLSRGARAFIRDFDQNYGVTPRKFRLREY